MAGEEFISQLPEKTTAINSTDELIVNSGGTTHRIKAEKFKGTPGEDGNPGLDGNPGTPGKDAYQIWLDAGNTGSKAVFLESLNGTDGTDGEDGTPGSNGKDAYQLWIELGNTGTEQDFLNSLNGTNGEDGKDGVEFDYRGEYDSGTSYDKGHVVISAGSGYVSLIDGNVGNLPQFPSVKWGLISAKGTDGEGAGDMIGANNLSELTDVGVARVKLDIYSKSEVDTKLGDYSLTTHNHNLADLSEKSYNSLDDKPDLTIYALLEDIVDNLTTNDASKFLSAKQGVVIKGLIDNINTLLTSDDTTLDEIQEIVDYIKQNKDDLANLSIGNIAGLQDALDNKQTTANLLTAFQGTPDDTHYISEKLAKDSLDTKANLSGANIFDGNQRIVTTDNRYFEVSRSGGSMLYGYNYLGTFTEDVVRFYVNSIEAMRLHTSGNLTIGTTASDLALVHIKSSKDLNGAPAFRISSSNPQSATAYFANSGATSGSYDAVLRVIQNSSSSAPGIRLENSGDGPAMQISQYSGIGTLLSLANTGDGKMIYLDQNSNNMAITIDSEATTARTVDIRNYGSSSDVLLVYQESSDATGDSQRILNKGHGTGLKIDNYSLNNPGIWINSYVDDGGVSFRIQHSGGTKFATVKNVNVNQESTMYLSGYYMWIDGSGKFRIHNAIPSSDTAGTIVGTQS